MPLAAPPTIHPPRGPLPVLLSVPHSGRDYPGWLVALACGGQAALAGLEDPLVDRLAWRAIAGGIGAVVAAAPRALIDCNRGEDEVDPAVVLGPRRGRISARARGGLGIVPGRTLQHGCLWQRPIGRDELEQRLDAVHRPYHRALETQLTALVNRFGGAILLDCHSMPPPHCTVPPVVIGDRHGLSAAPWVSAEALRIVGAAGYAVGRNEPFAGGHIVERHGRPAHGVHAVQLELDRRLYLDSSLREPGPGFDALARLIETLAVGLGDLLLGRLFATAAE